jgi:hypothetical protein
MRWFKVETVTAGIGRTIYIAWDESVHATAESKEAALTLLASKSIPEGYLATWHEGGLDADDCWMVTREDTPGLRGTGSTPELAVVNFEEEKKTRWYPKRFKLLVESVRFCLDQANVGATTAEFEALIKNIREGTFKYEG